ncbi:Borealin N terminal-domain-containing protein [Durotheca rogersii]|uniref:Borealin N terminal-domain-containing protein n=1 Tax=Durotheca rogersii TaxID=419775 RepID=UPI0022201E43|nr:Borealin N terminal-domain-containing protein [Durotheca rogersii]KAI5865024.1 Borealin N terminal-domain-containing protein [Durotheca rogersii]
MAPLRATRKHQSDQSRDPTGSPQVHAMTSTPARSPIKKRKMGVTLAQKQALIDNLQLEITERARRLRAQYSIQAQQLRSRVEMRINRIPTALRKAKMGDLLLKALHPQQPPQPPKPAYVARPPPVPAKDATTPKPIPRKPVPASNAAAGRKRLSGEISDDKENQRNDANSPKKRSRVVAATTKEPAPIQPAHVLSPTSSNTRFAPRERPAASPAKAALSRPGSPHKGPPGRPNNMLPSTVEKAKAAAARPGTAAGARRALPGASSSVNSTTGTRPRQAIAPRPATAASTRGRRKVSGASDDGSDGSTSTTATKKVGAGRVAKASAAAGPAAKKAAANATKPPATKKPPAAKAGTASAATGRALRKRN